MAPQNIPMRGQCDDGISLCLHDNAGNFKAILDLASDLGCSRLTEHMRNAQKTQHIPLKLFEISIRVVKNDVTCSINLAH